jgi:AraC family transcriptional regulator
VHPVYLATAFRQHYRTTVGDYIRTLRIDFACREMLRSDRPLAEIAMEAGFADQSHFSKAFKRIVGVPPSEYHLDVRRYKS